VTLVIIRLFTSTVTANTLPKIDDFKSAYNYDQEKAKCENLCTRYTTNYDILDAITFCQQKISIDIDGNFRVGEKYAGGFIGKIPYCEDGLYCFHIAECANLDAKGCLILMKNYYINSIGLSEETANQTVCKGITPGTCKRDPNQWSKKMYQGFVAIKPSDAECQRYGLSPGCTLPADWWWWSSGYADLYFDGQKCSEAIGVQTASIISPFFFTCSSFGNFISCRWFGCPAQGEITIVLSDGSFYRDANKLAGEFSFGPMKAGSYSAFMQCGEKTSTFGPIVVG
jgi:hypothetical protein